MPVTKDDFFRGTKVFAPGFHRLTTKSFHHACEYNRLDVEPTIAVGEPFRASGVRSPLAMSMLANSQQVARMTSLFLEKNHGNLARGLDRLSSGIKVKSSSDDAGSLAVSLKLDSDLKKFAATYQNLQNGRSFLSAQEDAYKSLGKILNRMAELRSSFDDLSKSESDRRDLDLEFLEVRGEVLKMRSSKFNGVSLFSTEDQSKNPFYLSTRDGDVRLDVTRTGFFESLTLATTGVGKTPDFTVNGLQGSMSPQAFAVAPQGTVGTDPTFAALQGTMAAQNLSVAISHSPNAMNSSAATDGLYDVAQAKPAVKIYDGGGTAVATVAPADVTLNTAGATKGTVTIDLSTLPAGVITAGTYTVKADNGSMYLDAADVTSAAGNQGSGYLGLPPAITVTGPSGASATGDPAAGPLTVDGATFNLAMKAVPDDDKFGITVTGTPTAAGEFTIAIDDGPMTSDKASVSSSSATDGLYDVAQAKPAVKIYDGGGVAVATVAPANVTLNTAGATKGTVTIDLSTLPAGVSAGTFTVKADDGSLYLDAADVTTAAGNQGSGYLGLPPGVTITGPSGASATGDPSAGSLTVDGATFAFTMKAAPDDDKFGIAVTGTPTAAGEFTIRIDDGPQGTASANVASVKGTSTGATGSVTASADPSIGRVRSGGVLSADGSVLYVSGQTKLVAINTATGADNWNGTGPTNRQIREGSLMAIGPNGNFYYSSGNSVYAFQDNGSTVTELGSFQTRNNTRNSPAVNAANEVFFVDGRSDIYVLDGTNPASWGTFADLNGVIWSADASTDGSRASAVLSPAGDVVYAGSNDARLYAYTAPAAGNVGVELWNSGNLTNQDADTKPQVDAAGNVYWVGSSNNASTVNSVTAAGTVRWSVPVNTPTNRQAICNPTLSADGTKLYVGYDRGLNAFDTANGNQLWSYPPAGSETAFLSQPAESNDGSTLYYGSGRDLHAVDAVTGAQKWTFDTGANINRSSAVVHPTNGTILIGTDGGLVAIRDDGATSTKLWDGGSGFGNKLDASTVQVGKDYLPTETLATGDIVLSGAAAAGVSVSSVTNNGDGTFNVGLTGTPAAAGTITVSINAAANGTPHLADLTNLGSGYLSTMTPAELAALTVTITGANAGDEGTLAGTVEGDPLNGGGVDPATGALNLIKFTGTPGVEGNFTVTVQNGPPAGTATDVGVTSFQGTMAAQTINVTKAGTASDIGVTAMQGTMAAQNLTVGAMATPTTFTSSTATDSSYQSGGPKPVAHVYDAAGAVQLATVDPTNVTVNGNGTVTIDLTTLPAGATAAGNYTVKAVDGPLYLDPSGTTVTNVGSGYAAVPGHQVVAPDGTINPGDVTASLTLVGNQLSVAASGNPTQSGAYTVEVFDGPLGSSVASIDAGSGYGPAETPAAPIVDSGGGAVGNIATTNNGDGTLRMDLSTLPAGLTSAGNYTVQAAAGTTVSTPGAVNVGSGYDVSEPAPTVTFTAGPVGGLSVASTSINPSGSVAISFAGTPASTAPITVSVADGTVNTMGEGLLDENLHLWDFAVSDFTRYVEVLSNARAVNGSETASFDFSENLLLNNMQNVEMANGRIVDTDMASEMTRLAKNQIKLSSATEMLAKHTKLGSMVDMTIMNLG